MYPQYTIWHHVPISVPGVHNLETKFRCWKPHFMKALVLLYIHLAHYLCFVPPFMKCKTPYWLISNKINTGYNNLHQYVAIRYYILTHNVYNMIFINLAECQIVYWVHYLDSTLGSDKPQVPISVLRYTQLLHICNIDRLIRCMHANLEPPLKW